MPWKQKRRGDKDREPGLDPEPDSTGWMSTFLKSSGPTMAAAYAMTGGLLGLGLLGYLLDLWLGTGPALVLAGLGLGLVVGFYELAKVMFRGSGKG